MPKSEAKQNNKYNVHLHYPAPINEWEKLMDKQEIWRYPQSTTKYNIEMSYMWNYVLLYTY